MRWFAKLDNDYSIAGGVGALSEVFADQPTSRYPQPTSETISQSARTN